MNATKASGAAITTAAALLFISLAVGTASAAEEAKVHWTGVNACKGQRASFIRQTEYVQGSA